MISIPKTIQYGLIGLLAGVLLGVAGSVAILRKPVPQTVVRQEVSKTVTAETAKAVKTVIEGPVRTVDRWYKAACPAEPGKPAPAPVIIRERVIEAGPERVVTRTEKTQAATIETRLDLRSDPAPPPRFAAWAAPQVLPHVGLGVLGGGLRIVGNVWVEAWVMPTAPALGAGVRIEF